MTLISETTALLETYKVSRASDRVTRDHMLSLVKHGESAFSRAHFRPGHFTASAFIVDPDGERLLLINHPQLRRWLQPGGHFEASDRSPLAAALREAQEEVSLAGKLDVLTGSLFDIAIHVLAPHDSQPSHRHFDLSFGFRARSSTIISGARTPPARWWSWAEILSTLDDAAVRRGARKLLRGRECSRAPG